MTLLILQIKEVNGLYKDIGRLSQGFITTVSALPSIG